MKKLIALFPLCLLLTGCPGGHREGEELGKWRPISISANSMCFSVNSQDVLSRYGLVWQTEDLTNKAVESRCKELAQADWQRHIEPV